MTWLYCKYCGKRFSSKNKKSNNQKYCCKACSINANRDKTANNFFKKYHSNSSIYKYTVPSEWRDKEGNSIREFSYNVELGSKGTSQTEHANSNFNKEMNLIKKEKKRLGLN